MKLEYHGVKYIQDMWTVRNLVSQSITEAFLFPLLRICQLSPHRCYHHQHGANHHSLISTIVPASQPIDMCILNAASNKLSAARGIFSKHRLHHSTHLPLRLPLGQAISSTRNVLPSLICLKRKMLQIATSHYILGMPSRTSSSENSLITHCYCAVTSPL